jgi:hypothetical protein
MDKEKEVIEKNCDCKRPFPSRDTIKKGVVKCGKCHKGINTDSSHS